MILLKNLLFYAAAVPQAERKSIKREQVERKSHCLQPGVLYHGQNLHDVASRTARDADECLEECNSSEDCHAVTWIPGQGCFLKDEEWFTLKHGKSSIPGTVSYVKDCGECLEVGAHYAGAYVEVNDSSKITTAAECWNKCAWNDACSIFTFDSETKNCRLHADDARIPGETTPGSELLSWSKTCASVEMTNENIGKMVRKAIAESSFRANVTYSDMNDIVVDEQGAGVGFGNLDGELADEFVRTQLDRLAENSEWIRALLAPTFGDEELAEDEASCKYDKEGNRVTKLEKMRQKNRAEGNRRRIEETPDIVSTNGTVEAVEEEIFVEEEIPSSVMFDDETAQELQISGCMELGVRYIGGNLFSEPLMTAKSAKQCAKACKELDLCYYFTFSADQGCRLKGKSAEQTRRYTTRTTDVSGSKECFGCSQAGVRYPGNNLPGSPLAKVASPTECLRLCKFAPECKYFTFINGVGCFLKTEDAKSAQIYSGSTGDLSWTKDCKSNIQKCRDNEYVKDHTCTACPKGSGSYAGADPTGPDTECDKCSRIGIRFEGNNLRNQPNAAPSAAACRTACMANERCNHITFTAEGECYLKTSEGNAVEKETNDAGDLSWSKGCSTEPLSIEEFKLLALKEGAQFVEQMKQSRLAKVAEIIEQEKPGSFEKLITSNDDKDLVEAIDSLSIAMEEIEHRNRRRNLQTEDDIRASESTPAGTPANPRRAEAEPWVHPDLPDPTTLDRVHDIWTNGAPGSTPPAHGGPITKPLPSGPPVPPPDVEQLPRTGRARRRNRYFSKEQEDKFVGYLTSVDSADAVSLFGALTGANSGLIGDLANTVQIIQPLIAAGVSSNREFQLRELLQAKLAILKALPLPYPIQILFTFAYQMVNQTNGHFSNRSINWNEMAKVIGPITVTAVLETLNNPHLKSIRALYQMAGKLAKANDLRALDVNDIITLATIVLRTANIAAPLIPGAGVPIGIALLTLKLVHDSQILNTPWFNAHLNNILGFIQGPPGSLVRQILNVQHALFRELEKVVNGVAVALFGWGQRGNKRGPTRPPNPLAIPGQIIGGTLKAAGDVVNGTLKAVGDGINLLLGGKRRRQRRRCTRGRCRRGRRGRLIGEEVEWFDEDAPPISNEIGRFEVKPCTRHEDCDLDNDELCRDSDGNLGLVGASDLFCSKEAEHQVCKVYGHEFCSEWWWKDQCPETCQGVNCGTKRAKTCTECTQDMLANVAPQFCTTDCVWTEFEHDEKLGECRPLIAFPFGVNIRDGKAQEESLCGSEELVGDGSTYDGCQHMTTKFERCVDWINFFPTEDEFVEDRNYCRNFAGVHHTIWCFTNMNTLEWGFCRPLTKQTHHLDQYVTEKNKINDNTDRDHPEGVNCGNNIDVESCAACIAPHSESSSARMIEENGHSWCGGDCDFWRGECRDACHLFTVDLCRTLIENGEREDCALVEEKHCVQKFGVVQEGEGVNCGFGNRATTCLQCADEATWHSKRRFCSGDCRWVGNNFDPPYSGTCIPGPASFYESNGPFNPQNHLPNNIRPEIKAAFQQIHDRLFEAQSHASASTTTTTTFAPPTTTATEARAGRMIDDENSEIKQAIDSLRVAIWRAGQCQNIARVKELLDNNEFLQTDEAHTQPFTAFTSEGDLPLLFAATKGCHAAVRALLEKKPHLVDQVDSTETTAMIYAAMGDHIEVVKALLDFSGSIVMTNYLGRNALMSAAKNNNLQMVNLLALRQRKTLRLAYAQLGGLQAQASSVDIQNLGAWERFINARDVRGMTALTLNMERLLEDRERARETDPSASILEPHVAQALVIDYKIDVMQEITSGFRPQDLAILARSSQFLDIILRSETYDFNAIDSSTHDDISALHLTVTVGWNEGLELVLAKLASSPDTQAHVDELLESLGSTALMLCAHQGNVRGIEMLIKAGADYNKQDSNGATALLWAIKSGGKAPDTVQAICENAGDDLDVFAADSSGQTMLTAKLLEMKDIDDQVRTTIFEEVKKCAKARIDGITDFALEDETSDCFAFHKYFPAGEHEQIPNSSPLTGVDTAEKCQFKCKENSECFFFSFIPQGASRAGESTRDEHKCQLLRKATTLKPMIEGPGIITGPKYCSTTYNVCPAPSRNQRFILRAKIAAGSNSEPSGDAAIQEFCLTPNEDNSGVFLSNCNYHRSSDIWLEAESILSSESPQEGIDFKMKFLKSGKYVTFHPPRSANYNWITLAEADQSTLWSLDADDVISTNHPDGSTYLPYYFSTSFNTILENTQMVGWYSSAYDKTQIVHWEVLCEADSQGCDDDLLPPRGFTEPTLDDLIGYEWCCMHEDKFCDESEGNPITKACHLFSAEECRELVESEARDDCFVLNEKFCLQKSDIIRERQGECRDEKDETSCVEQFIDEGGPRSDCGRNAAFLDEAMRSCSETCGLCPGPSCEDELYGSEERATALGGATCEEFFGVNGEHCAKVNDHISLAYEHCRQHCKFCEKQALCFCANGQPVSDEHCVATRDYYGGRHHCSSCDEGYFLEFTRDEEDGPRVDPGTGKCHQFCVPSHCTNCHNGSWQYKGQPMSGCSNPDNDEEGPWVPRAQGLDAENNFVGMGAYEHCIKCDGRGQRARAGRSRKGKQLPTPFWSSSQPPTSTTSTMTTSAGTTVSVEQSTTADCFDRNVDYNGDDLPNVQQGTQKSSKEECLMTCQGTDGCNFWTWITTDGRCYLKHGLGVRREGVPDVISGAKSCVPCGDKPREELISCLQNHPNSGKGWNHPTYYESCPQINRIYPNFCSYYPELKQCCGTTCGQCYACGDRPRHELISCLQNHPKSGRGWNHPTYYVSCEQINRQYPNYCGYYDEIDYCCGNTCGLCPSQQNPLESAR